MLFRSPVDGQRRVAQFLLYYYQSNPIPSLLIPNMEQSSTGIYTISSMYYIVVVRCSLVWINGPVGVIAMYTQPVFRVNNVKRTHTENQFD